ncbi:neuronal cell adhesion molecule-like [Antedon mediterranea]|uniref:neuronal cell adhesion molecule-like n=1 Tax=Antedon mediterranea TaxID=105859 RepID=UPI003AF6C0B4
MMSFQQAIVALILSTTLAGITHGRDPPDITGLKIAKEGFDFDLDDSRSYVLDSRNQQGVISKIWCVVKGQVSEVSWYFNEDTEYIRDGRKYKTGKDDGIGYYLQILVVDESVTGNYHCEAENRLGRAMSQYVNVTQAYIGTYGKVANRKEDKQLNEYLMLNCQPLQSNPDLIISWKVGEETVQYNDRRQMDQTGNLYISNLVNEDAGTYKCFVKNPVLGQTFYSEEISIGFAENPTGVAERRPVIVYQPQATTIGMRKTKLKIQCIAQGYPTPTIKWEKLGGTIKPSETNKPILEISDVDFSDAGTYRCTAENSQGSARAQTEVVVQAAPYVGVPMADTESYPRETAVFTCDPQGVPEPTFQWMVDGVKPRDFHSVNGKTLSVINITKDDSAVFQCMIMNDYGIYIDQATFKVVFVRAEIVEGPASVRMVEGKDANFTCQFIGKPPPTVTWKYKNTKIVPDTKYSIITGDENSMLTVRTVSIKDDAGEYSCYVENDFGNDDVMGSLTVLQNTVIIQPPSPSNVEEGNSVTLNCRANAYSDAPLVYTWEDDEGVEVAQGNSFILTNAAIANTGAYTCIASTDLDEDKATARITVLARPGPLTSVDAVLDTRNENKANLEWEAGPYHNSPITGFIIQARTAFDSEWTEVKRPESNYLTAKVDVNPGNTYSFRMAAVNDIGTSDFVDASSTVDTPSGPPRTNPQNVAGSGQSTDTMTITWDQMDQSQHGASGFKYIVMWRRTGQDDWMNVTIDDYTTTEYSVDGATTYESFDIKVIAVNDQGKGPEDEQPVIGHSGEAKPGAAPTDVTVDPNPTSIRVNWTAIPKDQENGKLLRTKIFVKQGLIQVASTTCPNEPTSCVVGDLKPNTDYEVTVGVENSKGLSPSSTSVSTTTTEGAPGQVQNFMATVLSDRMKLTWGDPLKPNGVIQGFNIVYNKINAQVAGEDIKVVVSPDTYKFVAKDLEPGETYAISIKAFTNAAPGEVTKRELTMRPKGRPTVITGTIDITTTDNEATVVWEANTEGPAASTFLISYKRADDDDGDYSIPIEVSAFQNPLSVELVGLDPGTKYKGIIKSVNDEGYIIKEIEMVTGGVAKSTDTGSTIQPWLIAMICIVLLLVLVLLLLCFIRSQKGGKYNVSDKEDALRQLDLEATPLKDQNGFTEYSPTDDSCEEKDPLKNLESAGNDESEDDSLADYAEGGGDQFNEDGSFINEYGDNRRSNDKESSNAAYNTFV